MKMEALSHSTNEVSRNTRSNVRAGSLSTPRNRISHRHLKLARASGDYLH
jgi:hypothetical protein